MTPQEAIGFLKQTIAGCFLARDKQLAEVCKISIGALEKQIPKKPVCRIDVHTNTPTGFCPVCSLLVHENITERHGNTNYCRFCGQALDWSDTE